MKTTKLWLLALGFGLAAASLRAESTAMLATTDASQQPGDGLMAPDNSGPPQNISDATISLPRRDLLESDRNFTSLSKTWPSFTFIALGGAVLMGLRWRTPVGDGRSGHLHSSSTPAQPEILKP